LTITCFNEKKKNKKRKRPSGYTYSARMMKFMRKRKDIANSLSAPFPASDSGGGGEERWKEKKGGT